MEADADERILRRVIRDVKERGRELRGCSRPVSDHRKADALSVCGANQSFG